MGAVNRDSASYAARYTNKYLGDARTGGGNLFPFPFEVTFVSASSIGDNYNLFVLPAYWRMQFLFCTTDGAGTSCTVAIGDSGASGRYMTAVSMATTGLQGFLAPSGVGYVPTSDTIVLATTAGAAGTVGKKVYGIALASPPAG